MSEETAENVTTYRDSSQCREQMVPEHLDTRVLLSFYLPNLSRDSLQPFNSTVLYLLTVILNLFCFCSYAQQQYIQYNSDGFVQHMLWTVCVSQSCGCKMNHPYSPYHLKIYFQ